MSTTTTTAGQPDPADDGVYDRVAFRNECVCSRCHAEIRDVVQLDAPAWGPDRPTEDRRRTGDGVAGYAEFGDPGVTSVHEPRTYCGCCGSQSGRADTDALSRREALAACENLHERLLEHGYRSHLPTLKRFVGEAKSRQKYRSFDTEIFRWATDCTIRWVENHA